jgi:hypothetical protein
VKLISWYPSDLALISTKALGARGLMEPVISIGETELIRPSTSTSAGLAERVPKPLILPPMLVRVTV